MTTPLLFARNVNQELYVRALSSAYRQGYRVYDPDYAMSREPDIYEKVRRDAVIAQAIDLRLTSVAGKGYMVQPFSEDRDDDKQVAKIIGEMLPYVTNFDESRYESAQAIIRARSFQYMRTKRIVESFAKGPKMSWVVPTMMEDIDRRRFRLVPRRGEYISKGGDIVRSGNIVTPGPPREKLRVFWELFSVDRDRWERLARPELFLKLVYNDEEARLGYGRG